MSLWRAFTHGGHGVDVQAPGVGNVDDLVEVAGLVLQVGRGVRRDARVQHRFVIEARQDGNGRTRVELQSVQLDGQHLGKRTKRGEKALGL